MKTDECKELAGWISLVHPEILDEFTATKKKDPDFLNLAPSQQYFDTKKEIDALIEASKYDFTQKCIKPHRSGIIKNSVPKDTVVLCPYIGHIFPRPGK